jgi:hypothetical protein
MESALFAVVILFTVGCIAQTASAAEERQITFAPNNHELDNNDNFSPDGRFLCFDTRESVGPGIDNSQSIEMVTVATGKETVLYRPSAILSGDKAAPGLAAASFSFVENKVAFIHGPLVEDVPVRGAYGKPNRTGALVEAREDVQPVDGKYPVAWLDKRDIAKDRDTIPGAHRGGTHRHEFSRDGRRIGFTYDDFLLPQYDRTIGYMQFHAMAPAPALCWFAVLVPVVPKDTAKPGEIERAQADSWVDPHGTMRAFIGKVRNDDGATYEDSLFVVDVPANLDITTADAGSATRYPVPPKGLQIRRLTHAWANGVVRGAPDGSRIAYYAKAEDGTTQIFLIPPDGSDQDPNPAKRPVQATRAAGGADSFVRWHPSGNSIVYITHDNAIAATCVKPGPRFGETVLLTPRGDAPKRYGLVVSPDGKRLAYNKQVPTKDANGAIAHTYAGLDFSQIFLIDFPDADNDGIAEQ